MKTVGHSSDSFRETYTQLESASRVNMRVDKMNFGIMFSHAPGNIRQGRHAGADHSDRCS